MKKLDIWQSNTVAPSRGTGLWFTNGKLKYFGVNGWTDIQPNNDTEKDEVVLPTEATVEEAGLVKMMPNEEVLTKDATTEEVINKINSLIVKLQAAGLMA